MISPKTLTLSFAALALSVPAVFAQQQAPPTFVRDACVKVRDGKWDDYQGYLRDVPAKLAQVRVNEGKLQWWGVERAVEPAGEAARCDYHLLSAFEGFPPEPATPAEMDANYERARISMSRVDASRRRDADSRLINLDLWRIVGHAGANIKSGSYVRRNFYKTKPGHTVADWVKLETTGWMQLAEAVGKEAPGTGWAAIQLVMPGGERLHYQAGTVDIFPDWKSLGGGIPYMKIWEKVHPDMNAENYMTLVNSTVERPSIEVYRIVHFVSK